RLNFGIRGSGKNLRRHHERDVHLRAGALAGAIEVFGSDAQNGVGAAVEIDLLPENVGSRSETPLPQTLTDHADRMSAGVAVVVRSDQPADSWTNNEQREVVSRDQLAGDALGSLLAG